VLTRILVGRVSRRYGLRVSLSPAPFADSVGSGAHQHFSLAMSGEPLFSHGTGVCGMTAAGDHCGVMEFVGYWTSSSTTVGDWGEADAIRVVDLIANVNAARIYRLGDS
jgi:hypothetical protein